MTEDQSYSTRDSRLEELRRYHELDETQLYRFTGILLTLFPFILKATLGVTNYCYLLTIPGVLLFIASYNRSQN